MSELNEKIVELLESDVFWETHEFSPPDFNLESAAKAIEILVLERELELIRQIEMKRNPHDEIRLERGKITKRINQLKQQ